MKIKQFAVFACTAIVSLSFLGGSVAAVYAEGYPSRTTCNYYYNQFDKNAKKLYDDLVSVAKMIDESTDTYIKSPEVFYTGISSDQLTDTMRMFSFDHPEFFWVSNGYTYGYFGSRNYVQLEIYPEYQNGTERQKAKEQVIAAEQAYIDGAMQYETDYERAKYLSETLKSNITYGEVGEYLDQSLVSAMLYKKTVCAGFTKAYSLLANAVGVDTVALRSGVHAWNATKIADTWYVDDVTNKLFLYCDAEIAQYDAKAGVQELINPDGVRKRSLMHELDYEYYHSIFPDTSKKYDGSSKIITDAEAPTEAPTEKPTEQPTEPPTEKPSESPLVVYDGTFKIESKTVCFFADDTNVLDPSDLVTQIKQVFGRLGNFDLTGDVDLQKLTLLDGWETPEKIMENHAGGKSYYHGPVSVDYKGTTLQIGDVWIMQRGDMTLDGEVDAVDATYILKTAANVGVGKDPIVPDGIPQNVSVFAGKYNNDGELYPNATDATSVLIYAALYATGEIG